MNVRPTVRVEQHLLVEQPRKTKRVQARHGQRHGHAAVAAETFALGSGGDFGHRWQVLAVRADPITGPVAIEACLAVGARHALLQALVLVVAVKVYAIVVTVEVPTVTVTNKIVGTAVWLVVLAPQHGRSRDRVEERLRLYYATELV
eukprot:CAMPEP_0119473768 /NCGR_PEP_ID=MMETSP1344-20130328/5291_1 /TAXON_ID=236787 /ORGANISM="Florenciella parvula, Strain CCMP2471" /LENGTH=146 /DNA_ID=CAMNT_0007506945 /DNA_START=626 /DNA_END=1066 /DNA_ORIENTATION=-